MNKLMNDIVEWDIPNWSRAIELWDFNSASKTLYGKKVLDIGGRFGGLSLLFALQGATVVCSDLSFVCDESSREAKMLHEKYGVSSAVTYENIDATNIPYINEFDIICFKSVLGGVGLNNNYNNQLCMMKQIRKALKPGGICCFAENLVGGRTLSVLRQRIRPWGKTWRYISLSEMVELTEGYDTIRMNTYGVIGCLGRGKLTSFLFGRLDVLLEKVVSPEERYIVSCVCRKI